MQKPVTLAVARQRYISIENVCHTYTREFGKLTFDNVKEIAAMVATPGTAIYEALVRVIESKHVITLEYK